MPPKMFSFMLSLGNLYHLALSSFLGLPNRVSRSLSSVCTLWRFYAVLSFEFAQGSVDFVFRHERADERAGVAGLAAFFFGGDSFLLRERRLIRLGHPLVHSVYRLADLFPLGLSAGVGEFVH